MSAFDDFEAEYLAANPGARADGYTPRAPTPAAPAEPEFSGQDLAHAAPAAADPYGEARMREVVWRARVAKMEREMAAAGQLQPAPGAQAVAAGVQPDEKAWRTLSELAAMINPLTLKPYTAATDAEGQRIREALFAARAAVMRGETIDPAMLSQIRANIATDRASADRLKAEKDARDLAEFRERRE